MSLVVSGFFAEGYRSLQRIAIPLGKLNVFVGQNGVGKTNLYRALELLQASASGQLSYELASEGGMESVLFAGRRNNSKPARLILRVELSDSRTDELQYEYEVSIGLVPQIGGNVSGAAFAFEPQVKEETLLHHNRGREYALLQRRNSALTVVNDDGVKSSVGIDLLASETALAHIQDPDRYPALHTVRRSLMDWRFYHDFRTDSASPLRRDCLAVASPTLDSNGSNLAAVFATLAHIREDTAELEEAVNDAFPGAVLDIPRPGRTASFGLRFPDYPLRTFNAIELSDGTLRYLALIGTLLAYRLPAFLALNEPEASLHPDLLRPLARLIVRASKRTQVWLVTHSQELADALAEEGGIRALHVIKENGRTWIRGLTITGEFRDT
ncbi:ATPase [Trinickia violacea]|uniref:ATPase n=1 Tax=Trinickia violacea TaxID=2571746 RepID=A0A4P8IZZ7_9BURK|nr:AAA family ATPase [Trinickia violacea]QCP54027.1 ATPase [Trinickia violacea]